MSAELWSALGYDRQGAERMERLVEAMLRAGLLPGEADAARLGLAATAAGRVELFCSASRVFARAAYRPAAKFAHAVRRFSGRG